MPRRTGVDKSHLCSRDIRERDFATMTQGGSVRPTRNALQGDDGSLTQSLGRFSNIFQRPLLTPVHGTIATYTGKSPREAEFGLSALL